MARVERIEEVTANRVRAGAVVSTMSQAVQELLSNSVDAGATCVEIKIDLPSYRLSVADNGRGIPAEKLQSLVATARATSKARSAEDMQRACTYGFRGEALCSLGLTSLIEIQSRCAGKESHAKVVREGQTLHFGPARAPLRPGTIVTLRDAFFKWPVRRKAANEVTEMLRIKDQVSRVALVNSSVAITVIDSARSKQVVRAVATGSITRSFAQLFSSDKLSTARKLTFDFKQFRITGYLSPPSSTACHWSKEFQFVYVNRRCVRRLDFLQKAINNAFAPCMTLLAGRGGADGQGVTRRVRDPNASSGQRQELFPVFVMNLECPPDEVDITSEPDKTWVEFSNWPAARNACVAMLLAFLSHFPHAVPSIVLKDLRRTFHRNEGGETWTIASPPRPPRGAGRASPEPAPSPSPSPMRLTTPDLGAFSDVAMGAVDSCAWMGKDPGSNLMDEEGGEAMEFQGGGIRGGGVLYPSPASRFGARDMDLSRLTAVPFGALGDHNGIAIDVSPHFARHRERRRSPDGRERIKNPDNNRWETSHSPFFDKLDGQGRYSGRESPQPQQLGYDSPQPLEIGLQGVGAGNRYRRRGDRLCSDFEPPVAAPSDWCPSVLEFDASVWEGGNEADSENRARGNQVQDARAHGESVGGGWAAIMSDVRSRTTPSPGPPPLPILADFGVFGDSQNEHREACMKQQRSGKRSHSSDSDSPGPLIVSWNSQKGRRVGNLPAVAGETHSSKRCKGKMYTAEGGNARSLSRLFDYAFTDKGRRQGLSTTTGGSDSPRNNGGHVEGGQFRGAGGGGSLRSTLPVIVEDTVRAGQDARRPRSSPPPPLRDALGAGNDKQALVGVTVRRPQSPQFGFMAENDRPDARQQRRPSWQEGSPDARRNDEKGSQCVIVEGSKCVTVGDSKADDVGQQAARIPSAYKTRRYSESSATPHAKMLVGGATTGRRAENSPLAGWAGETPSPEAGTACTPPRSSKRRRPESWTTANASLARNLSPFSLATGHFANMAHKGESGKASQPQSRTIDLARSPGVENRLGLEGGGNNGDDEAVGAPRIVDTADATWVQGRSASCDANGEGGIARRADGVRESLPPPPPKDGLPAADGRAITQPIEAEMTGETPHVDSAREADSSGWVEEDSPRVVAGLQLEPGMFAERPCLDTACSGDDTGWVEESSQRLAGLQRLDERPVVGDEAVLDVGATPGTPPPRAGAESGNNHNGPRDKTTDDASNVEDCPSTTVTARAADYDQDVLGGDGLTDASFHMPDTGVSAVRYPHGSGTNRERDGGGEAEHELGQRALLRAPERPISEVLQAGRDEIGAGAGAVAVTVTPEELVQAYVIGQAGRKFILLRARTGALLCVDQHAADERVKLEELQRQVFGEKKKKRNIERLELDPAETLPVTSSDRELLEQHRKVLFSWHFDVEVKGEQEAHGGAPVAILRTVPVLCGVRMSVQDLMGFLHYLRETVEAGSSAKWVRPPQVQHILNYKACHSAIRFGDFLSRAECVDLIKKLAACARPFFCAHGRPSVVPLCVLGGDVSVAKGGRHSARRRGGGRYGAARRSRWSAKRADAVG